MIQHRLGKLGNHLSHNAYDKQTSTLIRKPSEAEVLHIREKYPNHVIVLVSKQRLDDPNIDKHKFITPGNLTVQQFYSVLRRRMSLLRADQSLFLFSGNTIAAMTHTMQDLKQSCSDTMGIVHLR